MMFDSLEKIEIQDSRPTTHTKKIVTKRSQCRTTHKRKDC